VDAVARRLTQESLPAATRDFTPASRRGRVSEEAVAALAAAKLQASSEHRLLDFLLPADVDRSVGGYRPTSLVAHAEMAKELAQQLEKAAR
jgi:hypothetical protein